MCNLCTIYICKIVITICNYRFTVFYRNVTFLKHCNLFEDYATNKAFFVNFYNKCMNELRVMEESEKRLGYKMVIPEIFQDHFSMKVNTYIDIYLPKIIGVKNRVKVSANAISLCTG